MSYALLDAARVAKAAKTSLHTLNANPETTEAHQRKVIMIERIEALAAAAAESDAGKAITLTSEEFWLISRNW
ncbi:hypothetical protein [Acetobacter orleanensis]|uniref:Uncharacterized protein n=1 Tax=Acetobacter orleanensis TaxID=104099 RepID=A0A4Y3TNV5_9PROT|nr:hypothetical protein [Acetobacter orleanensis]KXV65001.1 hypothetical protein AD949_05360 [Acetobacter orleanensis]PCD78902.1 hypothetical protein CO710_09870 [Acetobacter orleanensis]GAN69616.1 hypothetical protein Abol_048_030 [Acetobacter orleanensis JCM 7639]GBR29069.1 hypothetical protein AA0473_1926 [Acetobacter orleanensis NRIC 0473]GEB83498.1 hypothetical protein AOR01nite_19750 [Acetobacter orleanensis]